MPGIILYITNTILCMLCIHEYSICRMLCGIYNVYLTMYTYTCLIGVTMMFGSMAGGALSDYSAARYKTASEGRLILPLLPAYILPIGAITFGLTLQYQTDLGWVLVTQSLIGFAQALLMPTSTSYLSDKMPENSGSTISVMFLMCFGGAAILVSFSIIIAEAIGVLYLFIIFGLANALVIFSTLLHSYLKVTHGKSSQQQDQEQQVVVVTGCEAS